MKVPFSPFSFRSGLLGRVAVAAFVATQLSSCGTTPKQVRENPDSILEFNFSDPYEKVYRERVKSARECFQGRYWVSASYVLDADLFPDIQTGEVTLRNSMASGDRVVFIAEITPQSTVGTRLKVFYAKRASIITIDSITRCALGEGC